MLGDLSGIGVRERKAERAQLSIERFRFLKVRAAPVAARAIRLGSEPLDDGSNGPTALVSDVARVSLASAIRRRVVHGYHFGTIQVPRQSRFAGPVSILTRGTTQVPKCGLTVVPTGY